jgi:Gram-negative bacterial TonB protein C-terminal
MTYIKYISLSVLMLAHLNPITAKSADTPPAQMLAPSSQWKVDYAERECRLTRNFGTAENTLLFRLARGSSFDQYDIMLAGVKIPKQNGKVEVSVSLEPQNTQETFQGYNVGIPKRKERVLRWFDGSTDSIKAGPENQNMLVNAGKDYAVRLKLNDFRSAIAAMKTCHDDLLRSWKIDPDILSTYQSLPKPLGNVGRWASTDDYPRALLNDNLGGMVAFKLTVGPDGKPSDCQIIETSNIELLDKTSCAVVMKRALFTPAVGADGRPASAPYINRIRWQAPE